MSGLLAVISRGGSSGKRLLFSGVMRPFASFLNAVSIRLFYSALERPDRAHIGASISRRYTSYAFIAPFAPRWTFGSGGMRKYAQTVRSAQDCIFE